MRSAGEGSALHKKCGVYLQIVGVAQIPLNYEDRLTEMFAKPSITFVCDSWHFKDSIEGRIAGRPIKDHLRLRMKSFQLVLIVTDELTKR